MGLGRKIALSATFGIFVMQVPSLASELVACDMKRAPRTGAAEAGVRKPAKPVERARIERRGAVGYSPMPSRRIILQ